MPGYLRIPAVRLEVIRACGLRPPHRAKRGHQKPQEGPGRTGDGLVEERGWALGILTLSVGASVGSRVMTELDQVAWKPLFIF